MTTTQRRSGSGVRSIIAVFLAALAIGGVAAAAAARSPAEHRTATVRLGLTDNVQWPFYDAARLRQKETLEKPDVQAGVRALLGRPQDLRGLAISVPPQQSFVELTATATTAETATAAATASAEELVRIDGERRQTFLSDELAANRALLDRANAQLLDDNTRLTTLIATEAELTANEQTTPPDQLRALIEGRLEVTAERTALEASRNAQLQNLITLQSAIDRLEVQRAQLTPDVEVLGNAELAPVTERSSVRIGVAAAVISALCGAFMMHVLRRDRRIVRTPADLERATPVEVLGALNRAEGATAAIVLDRARRAEAHIVGVVAVGAVAGVATSRLADGLRKNGFQPASVMLEDDALPDVRGVTAKRAGRKGARQRATAFSWVDVDVTVDLAEVRESFASLAKEFDILLVDCGAAAATDDCRVRLQSCDAVLLAVEHEGARISDVKRAIGVVGGLRPLVGVLLVRPLVLTPTGDGEVIDLRDDSAQPQGPDLAAVDPVA